MPAEAKGAHRIPGQFSIYLDIIRLNAALLVFLSHYGTHANSGGFLWQFHAFGTVAVVIFFVLSGYVIAYATDRPGATVRDYTVARMSRMYSVAAPAILLSIILFAVSRGVLPNGFTRGWNGETLVSHVVASALFLNQAWGYNLDPPVNIPYWSISYEVAFYCLFGVWYFVKPRWRVAGFVLVAALFGPRIVAMFPMWLMGVGCYHLGRTPRFGRLTGWLMASVTAAAIFAVAIQLDENGFLTNGIGLNGHSPRQIADDYLFAGLFALHLIGCARIAPDFAWIQRFRRPVRWAAGATFSIYLFHYPVLLVLASSLPWPKETWIFRIVLLLGALAIVFALAEVTERRRQAWRGLFERIFMCLQPHGPGIVR